MIADDGHVPGALPGFSKATPYFLISPAMGANLTQLLIRFSAHGSALLPADGIETTLSVQAGACKVRIGPETRIFGPGGYAFCPAGHALEFSSARSGTAVTCFRKVFEPLEGSKAPAALFGDAKTVKGKPFLGNPRALRKTLLPEDFRYDLALNIFTYEPGATLPFVETHIMEHGLLMLGVRAFTDWKKTITR